jgi:hypothetical protein
MRVSDGSKQATHGGAVAVGVDQLAEPARIRNGGATPRHSSPIIPQLPCREFAACGIFALATSRICWLWIERTLEVWSSISHVLCVMRAAYDLSVDDICSAK